jgi:hypothetical protein
MGLMMAFRDNRPSPESTDFAVRQMTITQDFRTRGTTTAVPITSPKGK